MVGKCLIEGDLEAVALYLAQGVQKGVAGIAGTTDDGRHETKTGVVSKQ
jgi:hypothetical protein